MKRKEKCSRPEWAPKEENEGLLSAPASPSRAFMNSSGQSLTSDADICRGKHTLKHAQIGSLNLLARFLILYAPTHPMEQQQFLFLSLPTEAVSGIAKPKTAPVLTWSICSVGSSSGSPTIIPSKGNLISHFQVVASLPTCLFHSLASTYSIVSKFINALNWFAFSFAKGSRKS